MNALRGIRRIRLSPGPFLDLCFPRDCLQCAEPVDGSSPYRSLCALCAGRLQLVHPPACPTCGYPIFGKVREDAECPHCHYLKPFFKEGITTVLLRGPARQLVHALKYEGKFLVLTDIEKIFEQNRALDTFLQAGDVLVPVPLHPRKKRERGFNQSMEIAKALRRMYPRLRVVDGLTRIRDTETQTRLNRGEREKNLKNAFAIRPSIDLNQQSRLILVDDVFTTGSTLNACASVLRRGGYRNLAVLTFGHG